MANIHTVFLCRPSKHFVDVNSFDPHNTPMGQVNDQSQSIGKETSENQNTLPKGHQVWLGSKPRYWFQIPSF